MTQKELFCHTFDCMFNERFLVPVLYEFYAHYIVSADDDNTIRVWDFVPEHGNCIRMLAGHTDDRTIKVWDFVHGNCIRTIVGSTIPFICTQDNTNFVT